MVFCGVYAYNTHKTPDFTVYHSYIYIIETHNFDSTMNKKITNRVSQSLDSYLVEIGKHSLQTVEEQTELAHRIKRGDEEALSELIAGDLRFVVSVAKQYQNRSKSMEELIEAGNKGLALAAKKLDPQRGFKFIAYAVWFIRASILAFLETSKNDTNLSVLTKEEKRELISKMSNERDREILIRWLGLVDSPDSLDEIGQSLNLTTQRVQQLRDRELRRLAKNGKS